MFLYFNKSDEEVFCILEQRVREENDRADRLAFWSLHFYLEGIVASTKLICSDWINCFCNAIFNVWEDQQQWYLMSI